MARELKQRGAPVALFLVDQRMPEMTGTELLVEARKLHPDACKVLLTAYADTEAAIAAINEVGVNHYLMKPWNPPEQRLYPVLDDLLASWTARVRPPFDGIRVVGSQWSPAEFCDARVPVAEPGAVPVGRHREGCADARAGHGAHHGRRRGCRSCCFPTARIWLRRAISSWRRRSACRRRRRGRSTTSSSSAAVPQDSRTRCTPRPKGSNAARRTERPRRPGGHELDDRELPRVPGGRHRRGPRVARDGAGAPIRRRAARRPGGHAAFAATIRTAS